MRGLTLGCIVVSCVAAAAAAIQLYTLDGINGIVAPLMFVTDTVYSRGYSAGAFRRIQVGMSANDVRALLGNPLSEAWVYEPPRCGLVRMRDSVVFFVMPDQGGCERATVGDGMRAEEVTHRRGTPTEMLWLYSDSPSGKSYRERVIHFREGKVTERQSDFYVD